MRCVALLLRKFAENVDILQNKCYICTVKVSFLTLECMFQSVICTFQGVECIFQGVERKNVRRFISNLLKVGRKANEDY